MSPKSVELGPLEMQVMGIIERSPALSVAEIQRQLKAEMKRELAYTTVMTVLVRLYNKGYLDREKSGRQFLYQAKASRKAGHDVLSKVSRTLFQDRKLQPILALLDGDNDDLSRDELLQLRKIVDQKLKDGGEK